MSVTARTELTRDWTERTRFREGMPRSPGTAPDPPSVVGFHRPGVRRRHPEEWTPRARRAHAARSSWAYLPRLAVHLGGYRARLQAFPRADETFVGDAADEFAASQNEVSGEAVNDHIPPLHAVIQERLGAIIRAHEDRRELRTRTKAQARVDAVIGDRNRLQQRISAVPVIHVLESRARRGC